MDSETENEAKPAFTTPMQKRSELAARTIIRALEKRQMNGYFAHTKQEALKLALSLIPEGSSVGWGGSATTETIGLNDALRKGNYHALDRDTAQSPAERMELMRQCLTADCFIMSTNAISEDGQLVNLDGIGNRTAALIFGPKKVIIVAGMNKVAATLDDAIARCRTVASPINAQRFPGASPCRKTGLCANCTAPDCICAQLVVTRFSIDKDRIHVILVGENLGF